MITLIPTTMIIHIMVTTAIGRCMEAAGVGAVVALVAAVTVTEEGSAAGLGFTVDLPAGDFTGAVLASTAAALRPDMAGADLAAATAAVVAMEAAVAATGKQHGLS